METNAIVMIVTLATFIVTCIIDTIWCFKKMGPSEDIEDLMRPFRRTLVYAAIFTVIGISLLYYFN
jgi:hypothetical protein